MNRLKEALMWDTAASEVATKQRHRHWRAREKMAMKGKKGWRRRQEKWGAQRFLREPKADGNKHAPRLTKIKKRNPAKRNRIFIPEEPEVFWQQRVAARCWTPPDADVENSFCWFFLMRKKQTCTHLPPHQNGVDVIRNTNLISNKNHLKANDGR